MPSPSNLAASPPTGARERILESAYELFSRRAVRDVGVDEVVEQAGVAKATLYRHFPSKDDLLLAFLELRERRWAAELVLEATRRGRTPEGRLLAVFDALDAWFRRPDFEACSFVKVLLELGSDHPVGEASIVHLANLRRAIRGLAEEVDLVDLDEFARAWHILMKGSMVAAAEGDVDAARRARPLARLLIERHRAAPAAPVL